MRSLHVRLACGLLFLCPACSSERLVGPVSPSAAITPACGPTDGPAVMLYVATTPVTSLEPSPPYFRVAIWQPLAELEGHSWSVASGDDGAQGWHYTNATEFEVATSGTVRVDNVSNAQTVEGFLDVSFPGAGRLRTKFQAHWIPRSILCG